MDDGGQLDQTPLFEFAQERTSGHVLELTRVGAPVPQAAELDGELTTRKPRLTLEQRANVAQGSLVDLSPLKSKRTHWPKNTPEKCWSPARIEKIFGPRLGFVKSPSAPENSTTYEDQMSKLQTADWVSRTGHPIRITIQDCFHQIDNMLVDIFGQEA